MTKRPLRSSNDRVFDRGCFDLSTVFGGARQVGASLLFALLLTEGASADQRKASELQSPRPEAASAQKSSSDTQEHARGNAELLGALGSDIAEVKSVWQLNQEVTLLSPRLMEHGQVIPLPLPLSTAQIEAKHCTTVLALGAPNLSFVLSFQRDQQVTARSWPVRSTAGLAQITRCDARRALLQHLQIHFRSPRGVVQFVIAQGAKAPAHATLVLPARNPGPPLASPEVGPRPRLEKVADRAHQRTRRLQRARAASVRTSSLATDDQGGVESFLELAEGCHRLDILASNENHAASDVDARLLSLGDGTAVAVDESSSPDASLEFCLGRDQPLRLEVRGGPQAGELTLLQAFWPLPRGLPVEWGALARSALANSFHFTQTGMPPLSRPPVLSSLGVAGVTRLHLPLAPETCYLLSVASLHRAPAQLAVAARAGAAIRQAQTKEGDQGTSLTLCTEGAPRADIEVQAIGSQLIWILGAWELSHGKQP